MSTTQFDEDEIDLLDLFFFMIKRWYLLLLGLLIGGSLLGGYTFRKQATYTSYASIFIQSETTSITSLADIQVGTALSVDFIELATSKGVLDTVITEIEDSMHIYLSRKDIVAITKIENIDKSRLLKFTVTSENQKLSKEVAENMAKATAKQVSEIMKTDEPTMVDHAELEAANSKGLIKKTLIGCMGGLACVFVLLLLPFFLNDKVVNEEDITKRLNTNVLGTISFDKSLSYKKQRN